MAKDLAGLPSYVGSRSEEFLNHIVGRSTDLDALPTPNSRIEEYLDFIARNGTGSGNSSNAFSSVQLSTDTNNYEFRNSNSEVVGKIPLMTSEEVENIKNLFVFN